MSLTFQSELGKSITKEAVEQNKLSKIRKTKQCRKNSKRKNSKYHLQKKNEDTKIPPEKVNLSSAEMAKTMEQKNTLLEKSVVVSNEEKQSADNIIPINILNRPSPIKEYRHNMFERSSRPSRNRVRD